VSPAYPSDHAPLSAWEWDLLRCEPPRPPDTPCHRAARNLYRWCQGFAEAELIEEACVVVVDYGPIRLTLRATEAGWRTRPRIAGLQQPLERTAPMGRYLRRLLVLAAPQG
jgi:hypothetical protein